MRHDTKYLQTHSAAVRQRPGANGDSSEYNNFHYHHNNHYRNNNGYTNNAASSSASSSSSSSSSSHSGGTVSALSGNENHESQKQWDWLEEVLDKSSRNKETVSFYIILFIYILIKIYHVCVCVYCVYIIMYFIPFFLSRYIFQFLGKLTKKKGKKMRKEKYCIRDW